MWKQGWRDSVWSTLDQKLDLIVIGGGITGAGILGEAARAGLRVLLVEAQDFASGTSSRSSKMVHGGFRYLKNAQIRVTLQSVRERERLLKEGRGLVSPLGFLLVNYAGDPIPGWVFGLALTIYDLLALKGSHRHYDAYDIHDLCPPLCEEHLQGGYRFFDAQTDDARLVLRLIQEAVQEGGIALNYARASCLLREKSGQVTGIVLEDVSPEGAGRTKEVQAPVVINATGAWSDDLRSQVGAPPRLRKLRGSHLIFPSRSLPLTRSVSFLHPKDGRPIFAFPWEGITLVGTTDVDLNQDPPSDPTISPAEAEYLIEATQFAFPNLDLSLESVQGTYSGIRPVIDTGKADPSKESREYVLWNENGLLTVAGGKLTTFRPMAHAALQKVHTRLPGKPVFKHQQRVLAEPPSELPTQANLSPATRMRLLGRYGSRTLELITTAHQGELETIAGTPSLWAELRWAARAEAVVHLDDLLLRRVRLGLLLPEGGAGCIDMIRSIIQPELGWDDFRWEQEIACYSNLWKKCYHLS